MILIAFITSGIIHFVPILEYNRKNETKASTEKDLINNLPRAANFWSNFSYIHINGNWSNGVTNHWITGDGSQSNPYTIENMTINAASSPDGNGIKIEDDGSYFKIRNCSVFNADQGIFLENTTYGYIDNCTLEDNIAGIYVYFSNNTLVGNNTLTRNENSGIILDTCKEAIVRDNSISNNNVGVDIMFGCLNSTIQNNTIYNNNEIGIRTWWLTDNITIANNTLINNKDYAMQIEGTNHNILHNEMINSGIIILGTEDDKTLRIDSTNKVNNKPFYFIFNGNNLTNANYSNAGQIILYNCNDSIIINQNMTNGSSGVRLYKCENITITNCNFSKMVSEGIRTEYSNFCNISDNIIDNSSLNGVYLFYSNNNTISNCTINNCAQNAVYIDCSDNNTLKDNDMFLCGIILYTDSQEHLNNPIGISNEVNGRMIYYYQDSENLNFANAGQVILVSCNDSIINNSNLSQCSIGISLWYCNNISISNNTLTGNSYIGAKLDNCDAINLTRNYFEANVYLSFLFLETSNSVFHNNNISNSRPGEVHHGNHNNISYNKFQNIFGSYALYIESSEYNILSYNEFNQSSYRAIDITGGFNNTVVKNSVLFSVSYAISLGSCDNSTIDSNVIINASRGLSIAYSDNCTICSNEITNTTSGIYVYRSEDNTIFNNTFNNSSSYAIYIDSSYSRDNKIYGNGFFNKGINHAFDSGLNTIWHNGTHGNYWDDYVGKDVTDDGIGDTAYEEIDGGTSQDPYPLYWDAPLLKINLPLNGSVFNSSATVYNFTVDEGRGDSFWYEFVGMGIESTPISLVGTLKEEIMFNFDQNLWNGLYNGSFEVKFYINDSRGLIANKYASIEKDIICPALTIISPLNNSYLNELFSIYVLAQDAHFKSVSYEIYGSEFPLVNNLNNWFDSDMWTYTLSAESSFTIRLFANDSLGNSNDSLTLNLYKDVLAPRMNLTFPTQNLQINRTAPQFNITIVDTFLDQYWYSLDNGNTNHTFTSNGTIGATEWETLWDSLDHNDPITICFFANDSAGNLNSTQIIVYKWNPPGPEEDDDDSEKEKEKLEQFDLVQFFTSLPGIIIIGVIAAIAIIIAIIVKKKSGNKTT